MVRPGVIAQEWETKQLKLDQLDRILEEDRKSFGEIRKQIAELSNRIAELKG